MPKQYSLFKRKGAPNYYVQFSLTDARRGVSISTGEKNKGPAENESNRNNYKGRPLRLTFVIISEIPLDLNIEYCNLLLIECNHTRVSGGIA